MLDKLSGYKTHAAIVITIAWVVIYTKVPAVKDAIGPDNFTAILTALAGMAGIALRAGVQKAHDDVADVKAAVAPPKAGGQ